MLRSKEHEIAPSDHSLCLIFRRNPTNEVMRYEKINMAATRNYGFNCDKHIRYQTKECS